ncbi:hypothetical protein [Yoonia sp. 2307UL14-13]|uniref:hypothetical protein n=1 Tax=Yoonia sp. 2307UL14-13 TaxID=3126506 RepID=UPI0030ACC672
MIRILSTTALATLIAAPATADGLNYGRFSYDFTRYTNDDSDFELDRSVLLGGVEYELGQFLLTADIANLSFDIDDVDLSTFVLGASGAYIFSPEVLAGAGLFYTSVDADDGVTEVEDDATGFEVFGQYVNSQFGAGVNVAKADTDEDNFVTSLYGEFSASPEITLAAIFSTDSEVDGTSYALTAEYETGPIFVRGVYSDFTESDIGVLLLRGHYEITPQIRATAGYEVFTGDDLGDFYTLTGGAGYQITDGFWADARYGILGGDDVSGDPYAAQLTLTYEFGERKRLDQRLGQARSDDNRFSALPALAF